ncbi:MAG: hypothetical protein II689_01435 [Firmicutes bacterium]|nr:hypothetical protein [Bacillota bacterium]
MVRIHEIKLRAGESTEKLSLKAARKLGIPESSILGVRIAKESVDAREKPDVYRVFSLDIESTLPDETLLLAAKNKHVKAAVASDRPYVFPEMTRTPEQRPVVCGFGPCGIFAALTFARYGLRPVILERGSRMERRIEAVESFWNGGPLDPSANVQFGEGGAGTFSDGKLTTGTRDEAQRFILETFVDAGASPSILYKQKPHIGTDVIRNAVTALRERLIGLGAEFRFDSCLTDIEISGGRLRSLTVNGSEKLSADTLVLAPGHSARDTFRMLKNKGLLIEQKQFAMGVRIEHLQRDIDLAQYAAPSAELALGPADYKLVTRTSGGRGVYTFCMCPGGYVVASASGEGQVVTNGMSYSSRGGRNANAGLLVEVFTSDFGSEDPLAGADMQERFERLAFKAGGEDYRAPAMRVGDLLGTSGGSEDDPEPTYRPGVRWTDLRECLPGFVYDSLREALPELGKKLRGFDDPRAVLTAIESRSSSPVRIKRNALGRSLMIDESPVEGLFPAGEGAGYSGGIMSSAADGVHAAEKALTATD